VDASKKKKDIADALDTASARTAKHRGALKELALRREAMKNLEEKPQEERGATSLSVRLTKKIKGLLLQKSKSEHRGCSKEPRRRTARVRRPQIKGFSKRRVLFHHAPGAKRTQAEELKKKYGRTVGRERRNAYTGRGYRS